MSLRGKGLFDAKVSKVETFSYQVNNYGIGSDYDVKPFDRVSIIFVDDRFERCEFPFSNPYTREQWDVLADVADMIAKIEKGKLTP